MRRFIKLLSPLLLAALFISCAQSVKQNGSITFDAENLVSRVVQYSNYRSAEYGAGKREFNDEQKQAINDALKFNVLLSVEICDEHENYNDSAEEEYTGDYFGNPLFGKKEIKFDNVPVGNKVYITATVTSKLAIKDMDALASLATVCDMPAEAFLASNEEGFMEFLAEEFGWNFKCSGEAEHSVVAGENQVPLKLKWVDSSTGEEGVEIGGTIEPKIPQQLTIKINQSRGDSKVYLNKGSIYFSLIDEDGNDLAEAAGYGEGKTAGAIWGYELKLGSQVIPSDANGIQYYSYSPGFITIETLPKSSTYQLYVQAQPLADGYSECATASAMFDIEFSNTNYYEFNAANIIQETEAPFDNVTSDFASFINSISTEATIKFSGTTLADYTSLFQTMKNHLNTSNLQYLLNLDFSEIETSNIDPNARQSTSFEFQDCTKLRSIILPDNLTSTNGTFSGCANLEKVVFGSCIQQIGYNTMQNCSKLSTVIIPEDAPFTYIDGGVFDGATSLKTLSLPETFVALGSDSALGNIENLILADEGGTWYYTSGQNDWGSWCSQTLIPPAVTANSLYSGLLDELKDANDTPIDGFPEDGTTAEKLLFAAQNTSYYFYCVK